MDSIINSIGGYDSWQVTDIAIGLLAIGLILRIKWIYTIPIPFAGLGLMCLLVNHAYNIASPNISNPSISGMASTFSILLFAIGTFIIIDPSVVARVLGIRSNPPPK